jgi:hypothetical protein
MAGKVTPASTAIFNVPDIFALAFLRRFRPSDGDVEVI